MSSYDITIQVDDAPAVQASAQQVPVEDLTRLVERVLAHQQQPDGTGITLVVTDDEHLRALNHTYNDTDSATDVLSFSAQEGEAFVTPDELGPYLGDIIISFERAKAQAEERGLPVERELALLVVHGCLHLIGYDHAEEDERQVMWALQDELLQGPAAS
ncbi:MAG: rRNA maturation RNase YbeY [Anaerolineae bacterium]